MGLGRGGGCLPATPPNWLGLRMEGHDISLGVAREEEQRVMGDGSVC